MCRFEPQRQSQGPVCVTHTHICTHMHTQVNVKCASSSIRQIRYYLQVSGLPQRVTRLKDVQKPCLQTSLSSGSMQTDEPGRKAFVLSKFFRKSDSEERADMSGNIKNPYWNPSKSPPHPLMLNIAAVKESIKGLVAA